MINFKRIIYDIVVAVLVATVIVNAAPTEEKPCKSGEPERYYDQRQNGTENYRLNIDGVVIAVAPAESLLAAASEIDFSEFLDLDEINEIQPKPKPPSDKPGAPLSALKPEAPAKPSEDKPEASAPKSAHAEGGKHRKKGLKFRLANILLPLLKKSRHHSN